MAIPASYRSFRRTTGALPHTIEAVTEPLPEQLAANEVLVKIHAVSLNFRDVAILNGRYTVESEEGGIPASDCAAEVVAVGSEVKNLKAGDHVSPNFFANVLTGKEVGRPKCLGSDVAGVLREYAVFQAQQLVRLPEYLSWAEGSTITCAGVAAWKALEGLANLSEGSTVLLEGTGGVSMFSLLILVAAGIKTIITSSSDEKIESIKKLSPLIEGINYKTHPDITAEVLRLTNRRGVNLVINNAGVKSIPSNISCLAFKGAVSLVGFLDGVSANWNPSKSLMEVKMKCLKLQGVAVGSKVDFEALNTFLNTKQLRLDPLIDRTFAFDESKEAFDYLLSGKHVGKVIITA